jgi:predicted ATP-dependent endonuclease of OLD family
MKLIKAHATTYRNIIDTNEVDVAQATCLVGKNEAGKTAFLKALEGLHSTSSAFKQYNKIENYPRRHLADYDSRHPNGNAPVIKTIWKLETSDVAAIEAELGRGVLTKDEIIVEKGYEETVSK